MSKIARVKFIRDKEPNIKALTAENKVLDGALYVATDTGTMWMGTSATSLIQIKDNINTNTTYTLTKSGSTITLKGSDGSSVNITDSNTIYNNATASAAGLMSAADKSKLDSVATGANKTVVDTSFVANSTNPVQSKVVKSALDGKSDTGHKHVKADITDFPTSMPASDVSAWAKAATKPSYSKAEVGLGNVDNTADANKSVKYATSAGSASTATTVVNGGAASADVARHVWFSDSSNETARVSDDNFKYNPNGNLLTTNISGNAATASSVTWGNVSGKPNAFTPASHTHDDRYYTESEINTKLNAKANSSHTHTKSQITDFPTSMPASDVYSWAKQSSKPSYTISEVSGNLPASRISGVINAANLPSYVDDVIEGYLNGGKFYTTKSSSGTYSGEITAEAGKIYVDLSNNKTYRWSGSTYVVISETIVLGTTHATAGYGDESRAAYNHSTSTGNPHKTTKTDLGLGNVENKSSATIRGELTSANVTTALGYTPPKTDTNTHYTTRIVAGAANGTANAATTNGNTHINVTDDNTFRSGVVIKGTGATSVTSDASGNITVHSTDTDTWRPVQNNLTSTATDQSLSAAQGKALNDKFGSYVPTSRTVNGKALSANISLSASDVGAAPASHSHSYLPLAGGTMTGPIKFNFNSLPMRDSQDFLVGIDAFDQGGTLKWSSSSNVKVGSATNADTVPWNGVSGKPSTFTPSSHTHDDRYYTESEINSKLSGKANSSHTHTKAQITDFPTSMPASDVYAWAKQSSKPSYSKSEVGLGNVDNTADSTKSVKYAASSNYANSAGKANGIVVSDTRNDNPAPKDAAFDKNMLTADFKFNSKIGSPTGFHGDFCGVLSLAPWGETSGGHGYQLAFGYASAGHPRLALRGSDLSATAWNSWYKIYTSDDKPTLSELGAAAASHTHSKSQITDFPTSMPASDVYAWAKASSKPSYSWSEISNKPSIPSVGNGTVTIKQNGAKKGSFTLNQSGNATIELTDTDTNTWRPEEVIISSTKPSASTCKLWIKI